MNTHVTLAAALVLVACAGAPEEKAEPPVPGAPRVAQEDEPQALTVGMYSYMADAASFTRCSTGARYPVSMEADHAALERAYLAASREPGQPVLVTVEGRVETRPSMEGPPSEHFIADHFDAVWPEETCEKSGVDTPLTNTYWRLVEINGKPVEPWQDAREMHMLLRTDMPVLRGFGGCNAFTGGYALDGDALQFEKIAATLSACPHMDAEREFMEMLGTVTSYRILGETLVLSGDKGPVARFRAVYF